MKKYIISILFLALILSFAGCNNPTTSNQIEGLELVEVENISTLTEEIQTQTNEIAKERGYYLLHNGNDALLVISLGQKPTAGFDIINQKVIIEDGKTTITFEEIEPKEVAAEVITYPFKVYKLNGNIDDEAKLVVKNHAGELFNLINLTKEDNLSYEEGRYVGQIDGHSIEIIVDNQPKAFEIGEIDQLFSSLNLSDGQPIEIAYEKNENDQLILKDIRIINNSEPLLILTGEAKYIGQIDPHSIELEIDSSIKAFQITDVIDEFNQLNLKEGDMVKITYVEKDESLVIKSINKL